ncbi:MAG: DUF4906 domain-containing protein [Bacteroidales bacterium]|nr:DUF4906 domain-containing protein [Bacteroidales bacterium]
MISGIFLALSACRRELPEPATEKETYREVAVRLGPQDDQDPTRSIVSIDIENFQKAALFAFDPGSGHLLSYGSEAGLDSGSPIALETRRQHFSWTLPTNREMDIYAIVNYGELDISSFFRNGLRKEELEALRFQSGGPSELKRLETSGAGMPMAGIEPGIRLSNAGESLTVHVRKLYAKFNIWFDLSRVEAEGWHIQAMHMIVENANTEVPYFVEGFRQDDPSKLVEYDRATEKDLDEIQQGGNGHAVTLYMLENCQGRKEGADSWKTVYKDLGFEAVRNCTYIDLSVKVRRESGEYQDLGYAIYLGTSDMRSDFDIRRNLFKTVKVVLPGPEDPVPASRFFKFSGTESPTVTPGEALDLYFVTNLEREDIAVSFSPDGRLSLTNISWQADEEGIATGCIRLTASEKLQEGEKCIVTAGSADKDATDQRTVTASWPTVLEVSLAQAPAYVAQAGYLQVEPTEGITRVDAEVKAGSEGILEVRQAGVEGSLFRIGLAGLSVGTGTVVLHHFNSVGVETGSQEVEIPIQAPLLTFGFDTYELSPDGSEKDGMLLYRQPDGSPFGGTDLARFELDLIKRLLFPTEWIRVEQCTSYVAAEFIRKSDEDLRRLCVPVRFHVKQLYMQGKELDWKEGGVVGKASYSGAVSAHIPYASADIVIENPFAALEGTVLGTIDNNLPVYEALQGVPGFLNAMGIEASMGLRIHSYKEGKSFTLNNGKPSLELTLPMEPNVRAVISGPEEFQMEIQGDKLLMTAVDHPAHYTGYGHFPLYAQVIHGETGERSSPIGMGYLDMYLIGAVGPYIHGIGGAYEVGGMVVPEGDRSPIGSYADSEVRIRENAATTCLPGYYLTASGADYRLYHQSMEIDDHGVDRYAENGETSYLNSYRIRTGNWKLGEDMMEFRFGSIFEGHGSGIVTAARECDRMVHAWFPNTHRTGKLVHFPSAPARDKDEEGYSWYAVINYFGGNGGPAYDVFLEVTGR